MILQQFEKVHNCSKLNSLEDSLCVFYSSICTFRGGFDFFSSLDLHENDHIITTSGLSFLHISTSHDTDFLHNGSRKSVVRNQCWDSQHWHFTFHALLVVPPTLKLMFLICTVGGTWLRKSNRLVFLFMFSSLFIVHFSCVYKPYIYSFCSFECGHSYVLLPICHISHTAQSSLSIPCVFPVLGLY